MCNLNPFFITCSVSKVKYLRGEYVHNNPINLSLCKSIGKSIYSWYPDNKGLFSIEFHGCDARWVYNTADERNIDYQRISKNDFKI